MTSLNKGRGSQRRVIFKKRADANPASSPSSAPASNSLSEQFRSQGQVPQTTFATDNLSESSARSASSNRYTMSATIARASLVPDLFTSLPPIHDLNSTETTKLQDKTILEVLPFLNGTQAGLQCNDHGVPHLDRKRHIAFLHKTLLPLPAPYVAADASRPWMFYWALSGLSTMGEDVSSYRERLISTVRPLQNATGGFGGGNGQMSHLAPTYAVLLSLVIVGGDEALDLIDRKSMWKWLGSLKQPNGGFQMALGGEVDVR